SRVAARMATAVRRATRATSAPSASAVLRRTSRIRSGETAALEGPFAAPSREIGLVLELRQPRCPETLALATLDSPDDLKHALAEPDRVERLRDVVDRAEGVAEPEVVARSPRREKRDRHAARPLVCGQHLCDLVAAHVWEHHVEED